MISSNSDDTIAAIMTPRGKGAVGGVRLSGGAAFLIASKVLKSSEMKINTSKLFDFFDSEGRRFDSGIVIYYEEPRSFTGEDVVEFYGHGNPFLQNILLDTLIVYGARIANPGEFSMRAFLNEKIDLAQAEAIADLINASSVVEARASLNALSGNFSKQVNEIIDEICDLRKLLEVAIDFSEDVDTDKDIFSIDRLRHALKLLEDKLKNFHVSSKSGNLILGGMKIPIVGKPNSGKSTLANMLTGSDMSIVSSKAGTTRDLVKGKIELNTGYSAVVVDTAGLRKSDDDIENEGISRARKELKAANVLFIVDDVTGSSSEMPRDILKNFFDDVPVGIPIIIIKNKIDLIGRKPELKYIDENTIAIYLSLKTGEGFEFLKSVFETEISKVIDVGLDAFTVRKRHLIQIEKALQHIREVMYDEQHLEVIAYSLSSAHRELSEIVGSDSGSNVILNEIFSCFCVGK